jgi:hypothetical protein
MASELAAFFSQRTKRRRKRLSQEWVRSTTQRRAGPPHDQAGQAFGQQAMVVTVGPGHRHPDGRVRGFP